MPQWVSGAPETGPPAGPLGPPPEHDQATATTTANAGTAPFTIIVVPPERRATLRGVDSGCQGTPRRRARDWCSKRPADPSFVGIVPSAAKMRAKAGSR